MYKILFCDLDGTLYDNQRKVSLENTRAVKKLQAAGFRFVACTGRHISTKEQLKREAAIDIDALIANNGAMVFLDKQPLSLHALKEEYVKEAVKVARKYDLNFSLFGLTAVYTFRLRDEFAKYEPAMLKVDLETMDEVSRKEAIYKVGLYNDNPTLLKTAKAEILAACNNQVEIVSSSSHLIEVGAQGVSKGSAIKELCYNLHIDISETIGIGDAENDLVMLKTVGLSACPANALDSVKGVVDYVCSADNTTAVEEVINRYFLERL